MEYEEIKKIMNDVENSNIDYLSVEFPDGLKIKIGKNEKCHSEHSIVERPIITVNENKPEEISESRTEDYNVIKSPMVGTFYLKPSPEKDNFVTKGDNVKKGETLCIIEAMKLMNEIESEFDGELVEILVNDGEIVEFGQELFRLKK